MITSTRMLTILGLVGIAIGIPVWVLSGSAVVGAVLVALGLVVLVLAAVGHERRSRDPEVGLREERADQQRLEGETRATKENVEDRPPPTGS